MVSIKKYLKGSNSVLAQDCAVLGAMGKSGEEACPPVGAALRQNLLRLQQALSGQPASSVVEETGHRAVAELEQWGTGAAKYFKDRTAEVKELMLILARAAEVTADRDQRYVGQFQAFTGRLETIADLQDLAQIRDSLMKSAQELKACAEAMAIESEKSVEKLKADVNVYQARVDDAERLAGLDPLTGLDNRRRVESFLQYRMSLGRPFCVVMIDLNGFKRINDDYGHLAGDQVLKQFASELKSAFRATDSVGRWGGDEFLVVLDHQPNEVKALIKRVTEWVFGDYTVQAGTAALKVAVDGSIGEAVWSPGETLQSLLDRADVAMYRGKRSKR